MNRARAPTGDGFGGPTSDAVDPIPRGVAIDVSRGVVGHVKRRARQMRDRGLQGSL